MIIKWCSKHVRHTGFPGSKGCSQVKFQSAAAAEFHVINSMRAHSLQKYRPVIKCCATWRASLLSPPELTAGCCRCTNLNIHRRRATLMPISGPTSTSFRVFKGLAPRLSLAHQSAANESAFRAIGENNPFSSCCWSRMQQKKLCLELEF